MHLIFHCTYLKETLGKMKETTNYRRTVQIYPHSYHTINVFDHRLPII